MGWNEKDLPEGQRQPKGKGRLRPARGMNRLEMSYSAHLEVERRAGAVLWYKFEGITLKLGEDCRFTPDFSVMMDDGNIEFHDTKALRKGQELPHIEEDARVKLRTAAEMYPFPFKAVWPTREGGWGEKEF